MLNFVANLTPDNIVTMNDREWLMTKRAKTDIETNILLLDIPKAIIGKYNKNTYREGKLFPIISNQKMNAYLKEIADLLEKAKLDKKVTALESERKNFLKERDTANGKLAEDPKLACANFVNALERIPKVIEIHEKESAKAVESHCNWHLEKRG